MYTMPQRRTGLRALFLALIVIMFGLAAKAAPTAYCTKGVSKPCGRVCISEWKTCRKSWTTATFGERPTSAKKGYDNPKFVEKAPTSDFKTSVGQDLTDE